MVLDLISCHLHILAENMIASASNLRMEMVAHGTLLSPHSPMIASKKLHVALKEDAISEALCVVDVELRSVEPR